MGSDRLFESLGVESQRPFSCIPYRINTSVKRAAELFGDHERAEPLRNIFTDLDLLHGRSRDKTAHPRHLKV